MDSLSFQITIFLTLDLAAPPFAPRLATCRRSESEHDLTPGDDKLGSGSEATTRAKAGSGGRLHSTIGPETRLAHRLDGQAMGNSLKV